jgi:hypothetical protein
MNLLSRHQRLRDILPLLAATLLFGANAMASPKSQCEDLMNAVLPFAKKMLADHGEFYPFGATMQVDGKIAQTAPYDGREHPPSQTIIDLLRGGFRAAAVENKIIASALVYDVKTVPPGRSEKTDAVAIDLDHRDNYSVVIYFPYSIVSGRVQFDPPFATKGRSEVFQARQGS